jgi:DNA repair photolyase
MDLVKATADAGARDIHHIIVRLNGDIAELFQDWIQKSFPNKADKVLNQIRSMHRGQLYDNEFKHRMRGSGQFAEMIRQQFTIAKNKYLANAKPFEYNRDRYFQLKSPQMNLFD